VPKDSLCRTDQLVSEAASYTRQNKHKAPTSMLSAGIEPAIPTIKRLQTIARPQGSAVLFVFRQVRG